MVYFSCLHILIYYEATYLYCAADINIGHLNVTSGVRKVCGPDISTSPVLDTQHDQLVSKTTNMIRYLEIYSSCRL